MRRAAVSNFRAIERGVDKDVAKQIRRARRLGVIVESCGSGHIKWTFPSAGVVWHSAATGNRNSARRAKRYVDMEDQHQREHQC